MHKIIPIDSIECRIYVIRGHKVMLDHNLAKIYQVTTFNLNKAVKRNIKRFPEDFMFQLTRSEYNSLRFQIGMLEQGKHSKYLPYAFTENGIAMLSSVLRSEKAIEVNIQIMRTFTRLRRIISRNKDLTYLFKDLGRKVDQHDTKIGLIIKAIEKMIAVEEKPKGKIGFDVGTK
ncbi:MAG: ORF6N domain-containing protein [Candidatus Saganbacteria bacterium]|nr:ORF6N domain-containing protein [Candidatus Saganbacteria bacterium]